MNLQKVGQVVTKLYQESERQFPQWAFEAHLLKVVALTKKYVQQFGAKPEIAVAGAWLHDIADVEIDRQEPNHDQRSLEIGQEILEKAGYKAKEIKEVLEEVVAPHSCQPGNLPTTLEGKVMVTADAAAHFSADFYPRMLNKGLPTDDYEEFRNWLREKLERDFRVKIQFDEVRAEYQDKYQALKEVFAL